MSAHPVPEELLQHLCTIAPLEPETADRLVQEILHFYGDTVEEFIIRRHRELQRDGLSNNTIYQRIDQEIQRRRFLVPTLSLRQIRRVIYG